MFGAVNKVEFLPGHQEKFASLRYRRDAITGADTVVKGEPLAEFSVFMTRPAAR